jgi:hypothetical protein
MGSLQPHQQLQVLAIAILAIFTLNCPRAQAGQCVTDYLNTVLPKLHAEYVEKKKALRIGSVQADRYENPKSVVNWSPERRGAEAGEIPGRDLPEGHWLSEWINKIHDRGAELRLLEYEQKPLWYGKWEKTHQLGAYFAYDREARVPYIATSTWVTPEKLAHEFDHLEKWLTLRDSLLDQGYGLRAANEGAFNDFNGSISMRQKSERTAIGKELQEEAKIQRSVIQDNPIKWMHPSGALPLADLDALSRQVTYPEAEAVKLALKKESHEAAQQMRALIRKALLLRLTAYRRAQDALIENPDSDHLREYMQRLQNLNSFFDTLMLKERGRFEVAKVYDKARELFETELPMVWESLPAKKRGDFKPRFRADH